MRTIPNREELDRMIDMNAIDFVVEDLALDTMSRLAKRLHATVLITHKFSAEDLASTTYVNKLFSDIMFYSFNKIINTINSKGEEGVDFVNKFS